LLELIDLVRSQYGYQDEYILDKTFLWLYNSCELIRRRTYDEHREQAILIGVAVAGLFDKNVKLQSYDELSPSREDKTKRIVPDDYVSDGKVAEKFGLGTA